MTAFPDPAIAGNSRIFIIDDHPMFRGAIESWLHQNPRYRVVGQASSATEALAALRQQPADAIVLDISLTGTDGLELIKHLRSEHPRVKVLVLSMHDENVYAARALRAGAHGYLMKSADGETLMTALDQVLKGEVWVTPEFRETLIFKAVIPQENKCDPLDRLSDRELEVLSLVGKGMSSREIAQLLHLSIKTIESHRLHLRDKLQMSKSSELVQFARTWVETEQAGK